jgi:hypothetical protein
MTWTTVAWHFVRLSLAAILLWYNTQLFLFYAFTILLVVSHQVNHLRALVRILSLTTESRLIAVNEHLGVPPDDVSKILRRTKDKMNDRDKKQLDDDVRLATDDKLTGL